MAVNAEDGVVELGECEGSLAEQELGYRKLNLIETANKRMTVHLCVSHKQPCVHSVHTHKHRYRTHIYTQAHTIPPWKLQLTPLSITHKHTTHKRRQTNNSHLITFCFQNQSCLVTTILQHLANLFSLPPLHEVLQNKHCQTQQALENDPCLSPNGGVILIFPRH